MQIIPRNRTALLCYLLSQHAALYLLFPRQYFYFHFTTEIQKALRMNYAKLSCACVGCQTVSAIAGLTMSSELMLFKYNYADD